MHFLTFLQKQTPFNNVPLAPFKGYRCKVLFHNGVGIFFLYDVLKVFFERVKEENKLLRAVYHDLQVVSFVAGCRALGLIDKLVFGPLWKVLEKKDEHILDINAHYQRLLECFQRWSVDASDVLTGNVRVFEDIEVNTDDLFKKLVEQSEFWDGVTKQILELISGAFVVKTKSMLSDHFQGGRYDKQSEAVRKQATGVLKTNVVPERDFGMLDRLVAAKPNAATMIYEGIIMFNNDTRGWREQLDPDKRAKLMELAWKSKEDQWKQHKQRQLEIRRVREEKMESELQAKKKKEMKVRVEKEQLCEKVENYGGLWKTGEEIEEKLSGLEESKRMPALKTQIQFRKKVLGATHPNKKVFQMSSGGKLFTLQEVTKNLKDILTFAETERREVIQDQNTLAAPGTTPVLARQDKLDEQKQHYR